MNETECGLCHGSGEISGGVCEACGGYGTVYRETERDDTAENGGNTDR